MSASLSLAAPKSTSTSANTKTTTSSCDERQMGDSMISTATSGSSSSNSSSSLSNASNSDATSSNKHSDDSASTAYSYSLSSSGFRGAAQSKGESGAMNDEESVSVKPVDGLLSPQTALLDHQSAHRPPSAPSSKDAPAEVQEQQEQEQSPSHAQKKEQPALVIPDAPYNTVDSPLTSPSLLSPASYTESASGITSSTVSTATAGERPPAQRAGSGWRRILRIASNANLRSGNSNKDSASRNSSRTVSPSLSTASFSHTHGSSNPSSLNRGGSLSPSVLKYSPSQSSSTALPSAGLPQSPTSSSLATLASTSSSTGPTASSTGNNSTDASSVKAYPSEKQITEGGYFSYPYTSSARSTSSSSVGGVNGPSPQPPHSRILADGSTSSSTATSPSASMLFSKSQPLSPPLHSAPAHSSPLAPMGHSASGGNSMTASTSAQSSSSFSRSRSSLKSNSTNGGKADKYKGLGMAGPPTSPKGFFGRRKESSGSTLAPPPVFRMPSSPSIPTFSATAGISPRIVSGGSTSSSMTAGRGLAKFLRRVSSAPSTKALAQQQQAQYQAQAQAAYKGQALPPNAITPEESEEDLPREKSGKSDKQLSPSPSTSTGGSGFLSPNQSPTLSFSHENGSPAVAGQSYPMSAIPTSGSGVSLSSGSKSLSSTLPMKGKSKSNKNISHLSSSVPSLAPPSLPTSSASSSTGTIGYASGSTMQKSASLQPPQSPKIVTRSRNGSYSRALDDGKYLPGGALAIPMPPSPSSGSLASSYGLTAGFYGTSTPPSPGGGGSNLGIPASPRQQFRRTYSSNSIKIRNVEVGPSSFQKIKLLGKGDVGKVYLVREKKTDKLFAMKVLSKREMIKRNKIKRALAEQVRFTLCIALILV